MNTKWLYSLLLVTHITMPLYGFAHPLIENAITYGELRQAFKHACRLENGMDESALMDEFDFLYFIEPCIREAEASLPAFAYCLQHPEKEVCKAYLQELARSFNFRLKRCVLANSLIMPYNYNHRQQGIQKMFPRPSENLKALEQEEGLEHLDAWEEFRQTNTFIKHMCSRFYRELSIIQKIRIKKRRFQRVGFLSYLLRL